MGAGGVPLRRPADTPCLLQTAVGAALCNDSQVVPNQETGEWRAGGWRVGWSGGRGLRLASHQDLGGAAVLFCGLSAVVVVNCFRILNSFVVYNMPTWV